MGGVVDEDIDPAEFSEGPFDHHTTVIGRSMPLSPPVMMARVLCSRPDPL